ncbi:MAG: aminotransferase class III-fold pyridoxal phosphate-dependent enzyme [Planctomycetes bacterium]|nr:aminotransferase class III-fold pyridoxal phosphate-dependent enzyme [Planctomycetota bacterium]
MSTSTATETGLTARYERAFPCSRILYERARCVLPGGVTHDARLLRPFPVYVRECRGARKWAVDGPELVDFWMGHGSLLLGHGRPEVVEAVRRQLEKGTHPGACHELEVEWAEMVCRLLPAAERVRFVSSGTEASLMAVRLARAATGRGRIVKLLGHFHGWHDHTEHGVDPPFDEPMSPGILPEVARQVTSIPPNDLAAAEAALAAGDAACVMLEPTGGGFGSCPLQAGYVRGLRDLARRHGTVLIFDEVITGFRVSPGGAQELLGIRPDLTVLAKVVAGGLPGGALAGRADLMRILEGGPGGRKAKMHHPGTFNANPLSAAAGMATLRIVRSGEDIRKANETAAAVRAEFNRILARRGVPGLCHGQYSDFHLYLFPDAGTLQGNPGRLGHHDPARLRAGASPPVPERFRLAMLLNGVDMPKLRGMTSSAHGEEELERTGKAFDAALSLLRDEGCFDT